MRMDSSDISYGEILFSQLETKSITNTVVETSVFSDNKGSRIIRPNQLKAGKAIHLRGSGYMSATSGDSADVNIYFGGLLLVTSTASFVATITDVCFFFEFDIVCRSEGVNGSIMGNGHTIIFGGAGLITLTGRGLVMTAEQTIDTTIENEINATYTWSDALAGNSLNVTNLTLRLLV